MTSNINLSPVRPRHPLAAEILRLREAARQGLSLAERDMEASEPESPEHRRAAYVHRICSAAL